MKKEFQLDQMVELGEGVQQLTDDLEILLLLDVGYHEDEDLWKCEFVPFIDNYFNVRNITLLTLDQVLLTQDLLETLINDEGHVRHHLVLVDLHSFHCLIDLFDPCTKFL